MNILPPFNIEAEEAVLGSLLLDGETMSLLSLKPEDFEDERHAAVFASCVKLRERGQEINQVSVAHALKERLSEIGGGAFLLRLLSATPTPLGIESYAEIVKETSMRRRVMATGEEIIRLARNGDQDYLPKSWNLLRRVDTQTESGMPLDLAQTALTLVKARKADTILHLPWRGIEQMTGPLSPGQVWVFGARTSVGKTTALLTIAVSLAQAGKSILYATAEELSKEVVLRVGAMTQGLNIKAVTQGEVSEQDEDKLVELSGWLSVHNLYIPHLAKLPDIERWAYKVKNQSGLDAVFVDYIQRFLSKGERRYEETTMLSNRLKSLAGEWGVPVIVASQFNREIEKRSDKRPNLSDLRDTGAIEEDADVVILLYRPAASTMLGRTSETEFIVAKNRLLGQLGVVKLGWDIIHRAYVDEG